MDCLEFLHQDHHKIDMILDDLGRLGEYAVRSKRALMDQLIEMLSLHALIEGRILYPAARADVPELEEYIADAIDDHEVIGIILADLADMATTDPAFATESNKLRERVHYHMYYEEQRVFPKLREVWSAARRDALGEALAHLKRELHENLEPAGARAFLQEAALGT